MHDEQLPIYTPLLGHLNGHVTHIPYAHLVVKPSYDEKGRPPKHRTHNLMYGNPDTTFRFTRPRTVGLSFFLRRRALQPATEHMVEVNPDSEAITYINATSQVVKV